MFWQQKCNNACLRSKRLWRLVCCRATQNVFAWQMAPTALQSEGFSSKLQAKRKEPRSHFHSGSEWEIASSVHLLHRVPRGFVVVVVVPKELWSGGSAHFTQGQFFPPKFIASSYSTVGFSVCNPPYTCTNIYFCPLKGATTTGGRFNSETYIGTKLSYFIL